MPLAGFQFPSPTRWLRPCSATLVLSASLACTAPDVPAPGDEGTNTSQDSEHDSGPADAADTADADAPGLTWDGDLAAYEGCTEEDPPAKLLAHVFPPTPLPAGGAVPGELVYANCSGTPWLAAAEADALNGVKLGAVSETVMEQWSRPRVLLPSDVPPDHAVRIRWEAVAPWTNGRHWWQWQLLDEAVAWLASPTARIELEVEGGYGPFTVHSREAWQTSSQPVEGPAMDLLDLRYIVIHYNGATEDLDGPDDVYTDEDTILGLRNSQNAYLTGRGYSLGYNSEIAPDGDEWEIRAHDIRSAANGCLDVNRPGFAIQIPTVDPEAAPTPAQVEGARAAIRRVREAAAAAGNLHELFLTGHGDVRPLCADGGGTECPGPQLRSLLDTAGLEP